MRVTYDRDADAAYISLRVIEAGGSKAQVPVLDERVAGEVILDLDAEGRLIGIEVLSAGRGLPLELLVEANSD